MVYVLLNVLFRYMYGETLGRWRSADLLIGLAYMARRELDYRPVADIAEQGVPFGWGREGQQCAAAQVTLLVPKLLIFSAVVALPGCAQHVST